MNIRSKTSAYIQGTLSREPSDKLIFCYNDAVAVVGGLIIIIIMAAAGVNKFTP